MSKLLMAAAFLAALAALAGPGCDLSMGGGTLVDDGMRPTPPPEASPTDASDAPVDPGFPCDVRAVLETYCASCHAVQTYSLASPFPTRATFLAPWGDAGALGDVAAAMVTTEAMPPMNARLFPTAEERAILIDWVAAGMPPGPCGPLTL